MEVQRMSSIAPFTVPHVATKDTHLQDYNIPKVSCWRRSIRQFIRNVLNLAVLFHLILILILQIGDYCYVQLVLGAHGWRTVARA